MKKNTIITAALLLISFVAIVIYIFTTPLSIDPQQKFVLLLLIKIYFVVSIYCIIASELSKNYSQVDRLWSILPVLYAWIIAYFDGFEIRTIVPAVLISLWGIRLTYNFAKKGGYSWIPWRGEEDYRWSVLKKEGPLSKPIIWSLFNILFISFYQLGLILYFTIPLILCINSSNKSINWIDLVAVLLFLSFLIIESIADAQQFKFQTEKRIRNIESEPPRSNPEKGFIDTGLWSIVRHPNYLSEQMIWVSVYLFGVAASGQWINWTIGGALLLILLFRSSSSFSESISSEKYPEYKGYIKRVGRFIPKL